MGYVSTSDTIVNSDDVQHTTLQPQAFLPKHFVKVYNKKEWDLTYIGYNTTSFMGDILKCTEQLFCM